MRLPRPILPDANGVLPKPCVECAVASATATETAVRKRGKKKELRDSGVEGLSPEAPEPDAESLPTSMPEDLNT